MASIVVTASQSDEERTLTGTPYGSATNEEGASGSLGVSWSEEASESAEVPALATYAQSASSDEADSCESTPGSHTRALTPVADQPYRWCVDGQYQVSLDSKFLNDKGVMTRTLTLERRVFTGSVPTMQRPTISSPDIDWSGQRVLWAIIVKIRSESSMPLTWLV